MEFYFQSNSVMNSLKCPESKSLSHCLTELFPIYQKTIGPSDGGTIRRSSHRPIVLYWRFKNICCLQKRPSKLTYNIKNARFENFKYSIKKWMKEKHKHWSLIILIIFILGLIVLAAKNDSGKYPSWVNFKPQNPQNKQTKRQEYKSTWKTWKCFPL